MNEAIDKWLCSSTRVTEYHSRPIRLARAWALLADRLARRGLAVSGGVLIAALSETAAWANIRAGVSTTIKTASLFAVGKSAGLISIRVTRLTNEVLKVMLLQKLKATTALVLVFGIIGLGAGLIGHRSAAAETGGSVPTLLAEGMNEKGVPNNAFLIQNPSVKGSRSQPVGFALAVEEANQKGDAKVDDSLLYLAGTWVETSVQYFGQELFDPPGTSNLVAFDGKKFCESTPSGKPFLRGEIKLVAAGKMNWDIDMPHNIIIQGKTNTIKTLTVAAIFRPDGKNGLQIAYFDPELIPPGKRPSAFESTATNGVVLITLKRMP